MGRRGPTHSDILPPRRWLMGDSANEAYLPVDALCEEPVVRLCPGAMHMPLMQAVAEPICNGASQARS